LPDSLRPGFDLGGRFTLAAAAIAALPVGAYSKSKSALHSRAYHTSRRNDIEDGEKRRVAEWFETQLLDAPLKKQVHPDADG
jgi:hypothetical protein